MGNFKNGPVDPEKDSNRTGRKYNIGLMVLTSILICELVAGAFLYNYVNEKLKQVNEKVSQVNDKVVSTATEMNERLSMLEDDDPSEKTLGREKRQYNARKRRVRARRTTEAPAYTSADPYGSGSSGSGGGRRCKCQGLRGYAGPPGAPGASGAPGAPGAPGSDGSVGAAGAAGSTGSTGVKGDDGEAGVDGRRGRSGSPGTTGDKGMDGAKGGKGDKGMVGEAGVTGTAGVDGMKGDRGDSGARGDKGNKGMDGVKGDTGDSGDGKKGDPGMKGDQGDKGDGGAKGDKGMGGMKGDKGDTGDKGDKGMTGEKGDKGHPGHAGGDPGVPPCIPAVPSGPVPTCDDQSGCIGFVFGACVMGGRSVCMVWYESDCCAKRGDISHACVEDESKDPDRDGSEDWPAANDNMHCVTVSGGSDAIFGVKDSNDNNPEVIGSFTVNTYDDNSNTPTGTVMATCEFDAGMNVCSGNSPGERRWTVPTMTC